MFSRLMQKKLMNRFSKNVSNLTRQEGVLLSKLIYREFNETVYDIITRYRGRVHAFFWNRLSKIYDGNLKSSYNPKKNKEDFYIEDILSNYIKIC